MTQITSSLKILIWTSRLDSPFSQGKRKLSLHVFFSILILSLFPLFWKHCLQCVMSVTRIKWMHSTVTTVCSKGPRREGARGGLFFSFFLSEKLVNTINRFHFGSKIYREFGSVTQIIGNYREINKPHTFTFYFTFLQHCSPGQKLSQHVACKIW